MKVEVNSGTFAPISYPFIGVGERSDAVVLFTSPGVGVMLVQGDSLQTVGTIYPHWNMNLFKPCAHSITMSND